MKKTFLIGWKDLTLAFRDRTALLLMLAAPFLLTLGLGFITGRFSGSSTSGLSDIPVILVNQDGGQVGNGLVSFFQSPDLAGLVTTTLVADPALARQMVDQDQAAAAIIIPAGFTQGLISAAAGRPVPLDLYANPTRPTSAGVVETIVDQFVERVQIAVLNGQVSVGQLLAHGLIQPQDAARIGQEIGARQAAAPGTASIALKGVSSGGEPIQFDPLAYMAPGMALMFLIFAVSNGGRTLLTEHALGTLPRLLVSPTTTAQVLGGKVLGIFFTGAAQMLILIVASTLLFRLNWGDPLAVLVLVLAAVVGAVGWGLLITALVRTPGQVSAVGSAIVLIFAILGGSFVSLDYMPRWFAILSKITPNAWGLDGFTTLALGGRLADILLPVAALLLMGALLFALALLLFNRRGLVQQ